MKVEFNTKIKNIKSGTLVKYRGKSGNFTFVGYAIYLTDANEEEPILYDLYNDCYYRAVDLYDIELVTGNVKLVVELE